jgi:hypothetical protein
MLCGTRAAGFVVALWLVVLGLGASSVRAGSQVIVTFETIPGGAPSDGLAISNQFPGATFSLEGGGSPVLAQVSGVATGFHGPPGDSTADTPLVAGSLGQFFLTDDGDISLPPRIVVITFTNPVAVAGGDILDVDSGEVWTIEARNNNDNLIGSITLKAGDPNTGDGVLTPFKFKHQSDDISSLRFTYSGTNLQTGFGFDNLVAATVPLPSAVWSGALMLVGGAGWVMIRRRTHATR